MPRAATTITVAPATSYDKLLELQDADICEEPVLDFLLESALTKLDEELGDDEAA
jgi:hypothetical protein